MQNRTHEFVVDGVNYSTTRYMATYGLKLVAKITRIAGGAVSKLAAMVATGKGSEIDLDKTIDPEMISGAIEELFSKMNEDDFLFIVHQILDTTLKDNRKINFDLDFCGAYLSLFKVLKEVLFFQYADFLAKSPTASAPASLKRHRA